MKTPILYILFTVCICNIATAQNKNGIHFQGIARSENGMIIANKQINLRISILADTNSLSIDYQEIKSVTTNVLGLFYVSIGIPESGKIITIGKFEEIQWQQEDKYLQVELDPNNSLHFLQAGWEKIHHVPYALYAEQAKTITAVLPIGLGGTGVTNTNDLLSVLHLEKVNNSPDSLKPISNAVLLVLNEKLKKTDTNSISNRINQKLNGSDTIKLSNRINQKLSSGDTISLSNRINLLNNSQTKNYFGVFYDTTKQNTSIATATAVRLNMQQITNKISVVNNTSNNLTRITVQVAGVYQLNYVLQFIKPDAGADEISVWIRKNSGAIANSNTNYTIQGFGFRNIISNNLLLTLNANEYIELFFSVKNANTALQGSLPTTVTPSRPATPSVTLSLHSINE
jgi:hypothetical protein